MRDVQLICFQISAHHPVCAVSTLVPANPMKLQFRMVRFKYSIDRIPAAKGDMWTNRCALYSIFAAKCSARNPDCAISTLNTTESSAATVFQTLPWIFNWTYLRFCCRYVDNLMSVTLHVCCQIHCTYAGLRDDNSGPCHIIIRAVLRI
jgi:hypothetical protein